MKLPEKLSFRPGSLAKPMEDWLDENGGSPSDMIRLALSELMGVKPPAMDGRTRHINKVNERRRNNPA